jgi:hypothetical protein
MALTDEVHGGAEVGGVSAVIRHVISAGLYRACYKIGLSEFKVKKLFFGGTLRPAWTNMTPRRVLHDEVWVY